MSELSVLIVDDEAPARKRLREVLSDCAAELPVSVAAELSSGREALAWLSQHSVKVALLDIAMPEMDGLELARHMQTLAQPPAIIFCTAFDQHAMAAFDVNAVDYLLKPIRKERLLTALRKARVFSPGSLERLTSQARRHLAIAERGKIILVPIQDVIYFRAEQKYVTVKTAAHEYLSEESLTHLESEFGGEFLRIHRNCMVARRYIAGFEKSSHPAEGETGGSWLLLLNGLEEKLPISRRHRQAIKDLAGI
jgi:two-component system response regulator AlgR